VDRGAPGIRAVRGRKARFVGFGARGGAAPNVQMARLQARDSKERRSLMTRATFLVALFALVLSLPRTARAEEPAPTVAVPVVKVTQVVRTDQFLRALKSVADANVDLRRAQVAGATTPAAKQHAEAALDRALTVQDRIDNEKYQLGNVETHAVGVDSRTAADGDADVARGADTGEARFLSNVLSRATAAQTIAMAREVSQAAKLVPEPAATRAAHALVRMLRAAAGRQAQGARAASKTR
jgi:hypothetical protein